jgi:hypothetical protein
MADKELETEAIPIDVTPHIGPDGKLTPEGLAAVRSDLLRGLRKRFPRASEANLTKTMEEMTIGIETFNAHEIKIAIAARGLIQTCRKYGDSIEELSNAFVSLAELIDSSKDRKHAGPHVFSCGQASNDVATAYMCLTSAATILESMLNCQCGQERESSAPDGEKLN